MAKRILIENHLATQSIRSVLDIGYGKGGDQWKYKRVSPPILEIFASEPDLEHWKEAQSRLAELGGRLKIHQVQIGTLCQNLDIGKLQDQLQAAVRPLGMAMFFSFAYLWQREEDFHHWIEVVKTSNTKVMVLTFLDQYELRSQMEQNSRLVLWRKDDSSWQDIQFNAQGYYDAIDRGESVFGHEVQVSVFPSETAKQVVEWVVNQPFLFRELQQRGWTLQKTGLFHTLLQSNTVDPWNRLFRWQVWVQQSQ